MNSVMVALPLSLPLLILLLPYCSSRHYATTSIGVVDFPLTAFLASSRRQHHRGVTLSETDAAASSLFARRISCSCHQHSMLAKSSTGISSSSRGNTNNRKWNGVASSSFYHVSPSTSTSTTLNSSSSSSSSSEYSDDEIDRFHNVNVAGVSVSPQGFLVLLQSEFDSNNNVAVGGSGVHDNDDGGANVDAGDKDIISTATSGLTFPILLTSAPLQDALTTTTIEDNVSSTSRSIDAPQLPELFQLHNNMDQSSVSSPEALTYLQLLNGVDMATPVLPPDILSLVCVWYAFLLLEEEEEELIIRSDAGEDGMENGNLVIVEDELGLNDSNNDDAMSTKSANKCRNEFQDALDYIRAMVRTTLPPDRNNLSGGSISTATTSYLEASPGQRSKVHLPRVWLRGVRLQEVMMAVGENDDIEVDRSSTTTTSDAITTTIGRAPIQFTLECLSSSSSPARAEVNISLDPSKSSPSS